MSRYFVPNGESARPLELAYHSGNLDKMKPDGVMKSCYGIAQKQRVW
jgi:hypothetical protein